MAADDTVYVPVKNKEDMPDVQVGIGKRLQTVLCIVCVLNTVLQLIAIVTPGWTIFDIGDASVYDSVYYKTLCTKNANENLDCNSQSYRDAFRLAYSLAREEVKPALVQEYNLRVRHQMNFQISWIIVVGITILQFVRLSRTNEWFPRLTLLSALVLMIACCFMYQALYQAFNDIDFLRRTSEFQGDAGFPYSVFLYSLAFVQTCAGTVLIGKQSFDYMRYLQQSLDENQSKYESLKKFSDTEHEKFSNLRNMHHDNTDPQRHYGGPNDEDIHSYKNPSRNPGRQSPRASPQPSPRQADSRTHDRYMELLERAHAKDGEHVAS